MSSCHAAGTCAGRESWRSAKKDEPLKAGSDPAWSPLPAVPAPDLDCFRDHQDIREGGKPTPENHVLPSLQRERGLSPSVGPHRRPCGPNTKKEEGPGVICRAPLPLVGHPGLEPGTY